MTRVPRWVPVLLLVIGVATGLAAAMMPWWSGLEEVPAGTPTSDGAKPAMQTLAGVLTGTVAAGWLLSTTLPTRGKQVVGAVLTLVGAALIMLPFGDRGAAPTFTSEPTFWPWAALLAGLATATGALLMVFSAPTWRVRADRFDRSSPREVDASDDAVYLWKALDAGVDPTRHQPGSTGDNRTDEPK